MSNYINPYYDSGFFEFFFIFFKRVYLFLIGKLAYSDLASDEVQILVLSCIAVSASLVGCFLVLKKMTMLANSLSHTILLGIIIAFLITRGSEQHFLHSTISISTFFVAAILTGILTALLTEFLTKRLKLQEDASTGFVFSSLFAVGIILVTIFSKNSHIGTEIVMGNVDALQRQDLSLCAWITIINILLTFTFYKEYKILSFDEPLGKAFGIPIIFFNYLLMIQVSSTIIGAFRAIGVLMVLAFIVGPPLISRLLTNRLDTMILVSCFLGVASSLLGVAVARYLLSVFDLALSTGGITVCIIVFIFILALVFAPKKGLIPLLMHKKSLKKQLALKE